MVEEEAGDGVRATQVIRVGVEAESGGGKLEKVREMAEYGMELDRELVRSVVLRHWEQKSLCVYAKQQKGSPKMSSGRQNTSD